MSGASLLQATAVACLLCAYRKAHHCTTRTGTTSQPSMGALVNALAGTPLDTGIDAHNLSTLSTFWCAAAACAIVPAAAAACLAYADTCGDASEVYMQAPLLLFFVGTRLGIVHARHEQWRGHKVIWACAWAGSRPAGCTRPLSRTRGAPQRMCITMRCPAGSTPT